MCLYVCLFLLSFTCMREKRASVVKKMFYVVWVKCWDDVWCQKYLSQVRFPVAMKPRNAVMSSVVCLCDRKKCLVVPSFAKVKTHTKVKLCLVLNKTMILFLRCFEWSVPTFVFLGASWMARTIKWKLSLGGIFVDLRVCVPDLRYGLTD